jgi:hypothetical protein
MSILLQVKQNELFENTRSTYKTQLTRFFNKSSATITAPGPDRLRVGPAIASPVNAMTAKHHDALPVVTAPARQTTLSLCELQPEWRQYPSSSTIPRTRSASILSNQASSGDELDTTEIVEEESAEEVKDMDASDETAET